MSELMRQAARMQRKIDETRAKHQDTEVSSTAVGDKVKATVTYGGKVQKIEIDPDLLASEGIDLALDGACAAINAALELSKKAMDAELEKITGGVKIPGMT
jgi:DNA-binding protein YbaB